MKIKVHIWEEIKTGEVVPYDYQYTINDIIIRNQGGKTYLVTVQK